jgi:hypothetical protein
MSTMTERSDRRTLLRHQSYTKALIPGFLVVLPAIFFYAILIRNAQNVPFYDDYFALLDFLNHFTQLHTISAKASYLLASQHNEYKLFFLHAITWLQFDISGHLDLRLLSIIGNGFILLLAILLWKMFLPNHTNIASRLAFFVPVSWLLFQLQYCQTVNWAMAGLQNLPVLLFSLGSIYLLVRGTQPAYYGALFSFILAVASSGNGFLLIPVGLLILILNRYRARAAGWLLASAGCIAAYAYHYNVMSSQTSAHRSVFSTLLSLRPAYVITFIGSAAGIPFTAGSFFLGSALCLFFAWMAFRGYVRRNPLVSYCVLLLLLTAVGVAGIRSDLGLVQSVSSRYTIYSALLLIFAWFAIVEEFVERSRVSLLHNGVYLGAVAATVLFALFMDAVGTLVIQNRSSELIKEIVEFKHPQSLEELSAMDIPWPEKDAIHLAFNRQARDILNESIRLGVYQPPPY